MAASSGFLLGLDYSEWFVPYAARIATDSSGALYILSATSPASGANLVTKLSADGTTILWQYPLGFVVSEMAMDPDGGVYVVPAWQAGDTSYFVAKLDADGTGIAWKTPVGSFLVTAFAPALAADSQGRAYVAGVHDGANNVGGVVRLNAAGTAVDYTAQVTGFPTSVAIDGSGAAFVAGLTAPGVMSGFLARIAPDGSAGFYSTSFPVASVGLGVAVDPSGNAVLAGGGVLQRYDSAGTVTFSQTIPGANGAYYPGLALDAAGNVYVTALSDTLFPVRNSLATCGSSLLSVIAPDGSVLQTTYIPGAAYGALIATGANSTVFLVGASDTGFTPMRAGPFPAGTPGTNFLLHLSPNANAQTFPLACVGNAASFDEGPIAPGEIVTLMGTGLGPQQGMQSQATLQSPFPTQAADVEVTFDGTPAPLLWVQDGQINAIAPWSLTPGQTTQICASYNSVTTNCVTSMVAQSAPAVFTVDGVHAAAVNQDGTINSANNPAPVGSIVSVWATGLGPITPSQADGTLVGLPLPDNVLPVQIGAQVVGLKIDFYTPFEMEYAGPAPYLVAGASQIDFQAVNYAGSIVVTAGTQSKGFQVYVAGQ
jgi:uncharacterized protein (TIGR03437 family)